VRISVHTAGKHGDSKFRTVELGGTELGTLRTCARAARARARRPRHTTQSFTAIIKFSSPQKTVKMNAKRESGEHRTQ
jgi:hypothetical protein